VYFCVISDTYGKDGFDGVHWGANPCEIHLACGVDSMHGMLQGRGKSLVNFICANLRTWKLQTHVNQFMCSLNRRTSHPSFFFKFLTEGANGLDLQDATAIPGIIVQLAVALGDCPPGHTFSGVSRTGLTKQKLQQMQQCVYLFLRCCRLKKKSKYTLADVMDFESTIHAYLLSMRDVFQTVSKSSCNYPKFHSIIHFGLQITQFGDLFFTDTNTWEHYHQVAAKSVYKQVSKRKKTLAKDMAARIDKNAELEWVFDETDAPTFMKQRGPDKPDLTKLLQADEDFKMVESHMEIDWNTDTAPDACSVDFDTFAILREAFAEFEGNDHEAPRTVVIGSCLLFKNQLYKKTRFADQEVIRLRATRNYERSGPWFDGLSAVFDEPNAGLQRTHNMFLPGKSEPLTKTADGIRQFYILECIFCIEGGIYCLVKRTRPADGKRRNSKKMAHPVPEWSAQPRCVYNWPLLQTMRSTTEAYAIVLPCEIESCVYFGSHATRPDTYWAVIDSDEMPHQEVFFDSTDDLLYQDMPDWFSTLGRTKVVDLVAKAAKKDKKKQKNACSKSKKKKQNSAPNGKKWYERQSNVAYKTVSEFDQKLGLEDMHYITADQLMGSTPSANSPSFLDNSDLEGDSMSETHEQFDDCSVSEIDDGDLSESDCEL
jgi:hypothetical protein